MCPTTGLLQLVLTGLFLFLVFQVIKTYNTAKTNFGTLSGLLSTPETRWRFLSIRLEGTYKGRKAVLNYWLVGVEGGYQIDFYIEPIGDLKKQKFIFLSYPKPTENTVLRGKKLLYSDPYFRNRPHEIYPVQKFTDILETLTQAAGIVESQGRK